MKGVIRRRTGGKQRRKNVKKHTLLITSPLSQGLSWLQSTQSWPPPFTRRLWRPPPLLPSVKHTLWQRRTDRPINPWGFGSVLMSAIDVCHLPWSRTKPSSVSSASRAVPQLTQQRGQPLAGKRLWAERSRWRVWCWWWCWGSLRSDSHMQPTAHGNNLITATSMEPSAHSAVWRKRLRKCLPTSPKTQLICKYTWSHIQ